MSGVEIAGILVPAAVSLATPVVAFLFSKVKQGSISLDDTHQVLNFGLEGLVALRKVINNEISGNIIQKVPLRVYNNWKERVSNIENQVASLNKEYEEVRGKKWNISRKSDLLSEMKKAVNEVVSILGECTQEILIDKPRELAIEEKGVPPIRGYLPLENAFQKILTLLQNDRVKCVALHGQKGVGKTTIMRHLNNHFYDSVGKFFDMVIFIKVPTDDKQTDPQTEDLHVLCKIADRIKVDREGDESEVSGRIQQVLENTRYLLILDGIRCTPDGIWEKLDISKGNSKVVITTDNPLAFKSKYVDRNVPLQPLHPDEAWKMFRNVIGDNLIQDIPNARRICNRFCSCLPLLIYPIASSFKCRQASTDWQSVLDECTSWAQLGVDGLEELYENLKICYKSLPNQSDRKCFHYASLYPANSKIYTRYLVECCIVLGLVGDVDANTDYKALRSRVIDVTLRRLVNFAFLEEGGKMRYVTMNDFYRQFAIYMSSKDSTSECRSYVDNEEEQAFRSASQHHTWVSRIGSRWNSPPTNQNFASLQILLLQKNLKLDQIPPEYFDGMGNLLVLNLYGTKLRRLPSLSGLTKLKAFYLNDCSDLEIESSEIQPLKNLEVFDIRGARINSMPRLERLWCLRISYDEGGDYSGISELHNLEELMVEIEKQFIQQWFNGGENDMTNATSSLEKLRIYLPYSKQFGVASS
ncbi:probable disease resistance protein At5g43740 [Neltuma alba]|uniref:probable disease resistance protein At5g43740 n=1 Tax=Neltuma alba TaxID=207710 RepID=UPI0010A4C7CE|nr:probable disease resistance protein At5g43740 [Prosopis alba]